MLDLHRLRLLREFRRRGTIAAVAQALSYSPSTVSHQLGELQVEAGVRLLERDGRRLRLTEAGHVLAGHAEVLLARLEQAEAEMAAAAGAVAGVVRVAAFQTAAVHLVAPALTALARDHPGVRGEITELESDQALDALLRRETDLAICDDHDGRPRRELRGLSFEDLYAERVRLVVPRGHPARELADVAGATWAGGHRGTSHERLVRDVCMAKGGFQPDLRHRATDLLVLLALVGAGQAVTLLPDLARPERESSVEVHDIGVGRRIFTVVRDDGLSRPALVATRAALRTAATLFT
ncbi:LysR family transcriptional regulator [Nonomuraea maheshkhaliensis]